MSIPEGRPREFLVMEGILVLELVGRSASFLYIVVMRLGVDGYAFPAVLLVLHIELLLASCSTLLLVLATQGGLAEPWSTSPPCSSGGR